MRSLLVISLILVLGACTRMSADFHLDNAYRQYAIGDCAAVALELSQAQRGIRSRPYLQPEISLLRGQCLEREHLYVDAQQTYQYILAHYPQTEYAYRAKTRLSTLEQLGRLRDVEPAKVSRAL